MDILCRNIYNIPDINKYKEKIDNDWYLNDTFIFCIFKLDHLEFLYTFPSHETTFIFLFVLSKNILNENNILLEYFKLL